MKAVVSICVLLSILIDPLSALVCMACDVKNANSTNCELNYTCPVGVTSCETIVSKVEGVYAITASCATEDKCGNKTAVYGLEKCNHLL